MRPKTVSPIGATQKTVVRDGEEILGIGDQGSQGVGISMLNCPSASDPVSLTAGLISRL